MKLILVAFALFLAAPATAFAEASLTMREVPLHGERSLAATAPARFDLVGLHWRGSGGVEFRTRSTAGRWSPWHRAAPEGEDLPDAGSAETRPGRGWRLGNPYWTGPSNRIAYRLRGHVDRLRAYFVRSPEEMIPLRRLSVAGSPPLLTRLSWGANESIRRAAPQYAPSVQFAVVHHTAGSNSYTRAQSAAIVRGIEIYHVKGNGWNDIGYNFLVDRYGQVFEGRYGGVEKNVIGAHAEGFNTGSTGVALIGTYASTGPTPAERSALVKLLAWRLDVAHVDPVSRLTYASGGNPRFAQGAPVPLRAVSGHRDTGFTSCPGAVVYAQLGAIAQQAGQQGLPKLYAPSVRGSPGGQVRFRARLSQVLPWTVTVTDALGVTVGSGTGVEPVDRLDLGCVSGAEGVLCMDDRSRGRCPRRKRHLRCTAGLTDAEDGNRQAACDLAGRRRRLRLQPDLVHTQRARDRHGGAERSRRTGAVCPLHAATQGGCQYVHLRAHGPCRRPVPDRSHRDRHQANGDGRCPCSPRPHHSAVRCDDRPWCPRTETA